MSSFLILRALLFAGECFLASLLLPLLAFAVTALMRRRAALRHLVWTTMFGVLAVLPFVALLLPARQLAHPAAAPVMAAAPDLLAVPVMSAPQPAVVAGNLLSAGNIVLLLLILWLAGIAFQALRLGLGGIGLVRLRRASVPFVPELETGCAVRLADGEHGPSTFGILSPVVLLPRSAADWPAVRLEAVLRHEAAHVARRDALSQLVARLVCAVWWFNPLLWLGYRSLRRDAEIAADDAVLAGGMTPSLYATELVRLAAGARGVTVGVAMAGPPLTQRVEAVLSDNVSRKGVSRMDMARTVSLGLAAALLLGAARFDLAVAQDVAPKVERNVETDVAVEAGAMKAESDRLAADAARALAHTEEARKAAQDVVSTKIRRAMTRTGNPDDAVAAAKSLAALEQAEKAARDVEMTETRNAMRRAGADNAGVQRAIAAQAAAVKALARQKVDGARQKASEFQRAAMARSETALARTQEVLARQEAQAQAGGKADPGKQQLMQLMADSVAVARQEMAKAREQAETDARSVRARDFDYGIDYSKTDKDGSHMDFGFRLMPDGAEITPEIAEAMQKPEVRQAIDDAVRMAMVQARDAVKAAIAKATGHAVLPSDARAKPVPPAPFAPLTPRY